MAWTPQVPNRPQRGRHSLTPEEQNATTNPLPLASLPIARPPARHALESPPPPSGGARHSLAWPTEEPDARVPWPQIADREYPALAAADDWSVDPLADTASMGLQKFNIGTVPASITPPASSKRAAWFSTAAAAGALVSLIAVSTAFMGAPESERQIGALPGIPPFSGEPSFDTNIPPDNLRGQPGEQSSRNRENRTSRQDDNGPQTSGLAGTGARGPVESLFAPDSPSGPAGAGQAGAGSGGPGGSGGSSVPSIAPTGPPQIIIEPPPPAMQGVAQPVDGRQIADRSVQYLQLVADDPDAAYAMTGGSLRGEGPQGIEQRYDDVSDVHVQTVRASPARAQTTNIVTITKTDGSSITERRTLQFTRSGNPKIQSDS